MLRSVQSMAREQKSSIKETTKESLIKDTTRESVIRTPKAGSSTAFKNLVDAITLSAARDPKIARALEKFYSEFGGSAEFSTNLNRVPTLWRNMLNSIIEAHGIQPPWEQLGEDASAKVAKSKTAAPSKNGDTFVWRFWDTMPYFSEGLPQLMNNDTFGFESILGANRVIDITFYNPSGRKEIQDNDNSEGEFVQVEIPFKVTNQAMFKWSNTVKFFNKMKNNSGVDWAKLDPQTLDWFKIDPPTNDTIFVK